MMQARGIFWKLGKILINFEGLNDLCRCKRRYQPEYHLAKLLKMALIASCELVFFLTEENISIFDEDDGSLLHQSLVFVFLKSVLSVFFFSSRLYECG